MPNHRLISIFLALPAFLVFFSCNQPSPSTNAISEQGLSIGAACPSPGNCCYWDDDIGRCTGNDACYGADDANGFYWAKCEKCLPDGSCEKVIGKYEDSACAKTNLGSQNCPDDTINTDETDENE
jgi:hypothetical protein